MEMTILPIPPRTAIKAAGFFLTTNLHIALHMDALTVVFLAIFSYFAGTFPGAKLVCRLFNLGNPLSHGSGNPGATNVYRLGGATPAALTLFLDAGKGALAVALAQQLQLSALWQLSAALLAILGHMYPVFDHFRGGKGVATTLGAGLMLSPVLTLLLTTLWSLVLYRFKVSAIASVSAASVAPFLAFWLDRSLTLFFTLLAILIIYRHRSNFRRNHLSHANVNPPSSDHSA